MARDACMARQKNAHERYVGLSVGESLGSCIRRAVVDYV